MSQTHEIKLAGPAVHTDRADGLMLRDLLDVLVDGSQGAARFALEGRSTASGPAPGATWSRRAAVAAFLLRARGAGRACDRGGRDQAQQPRSAS